MRTRLLLGVVLLVISPSLWGQTTPRLEFFGGYSYLNTNPGRGLSGANASGWNASANWSFKRWLGLKADIDGHYCCDGQREHNFFIGPQFTLRGDRVTLFFHVMGGVTHGTADQPQFSVTVAAWESGGGLDLKIFKTDRIVVRLAQVDYLGTRYAHFTQQHFRYSGGLVFRFGKK